MKEKDYIVTVTTTVEYDYHIRATSAVKAANEGEETFKEEHRKLHADNITVRRYK